MLSVDLVVLTQEKKQAVLSIISDFGLLVLAESLFGLVEQLNLRDILVNLYKATGGRNFGKLSSILGLICR